MRDFHLPPPGLRQDSERRRFFAAKRGEAEVFGTGEAATTLGAGGPRFGLIVHHTDAEREYAYDRDSHFGRLDKALDAAAVNRWTVVDMKKDWKRIFSFG